MAKYPTKSWGESLIGKGSDSFGGARMEKGAKALKSLGCYGPNDYGAPYHASLKEERAIGDKVRKQRAGMDRF